jgi:hypothetical protein
VVIFRDDRPADERPKLQLLFKIKEAEANESNPDLMIIDMRGLRGAGHKVRQDISGHGKNVLRVHELGVEGA